MTKSLRRHNRRFRDGTTEGIKLKALSKKKSSYISCHEDTDVSFCGIVFHSQEAATGNAWCPMVERRVCWMTGDDDKAE